MRAMLTGALLAAVAAAGAGSAPGVLLAVDDGNFFYDRNNDCIGDTDAAAGAVALRHWHVGVPFVGPGGEPLGGFGCLGGPKEWMVTVAPGRTAALSASVRYTWDANVPGGCCNDVHLHVFSASGNLVASTLLSEGWEPIVPTVVPVASHQLNRELDAGTYRIVEDVFSGEHSAWLTKLTVTEG